MPQYWHPYIIDEAHRERRFVQARLADYTKLHAGGVPPARDEDWLAPEPQGRLLRDERSTPPDEPVHQIAPSTVPVLWVQRRCLPLLSPPTSGLRFDVMEKYHRDHA